MESAKDLRRRLSVLLYTFLGCNNQEKKESLKKEIEEVKEKIARLPIKRRKP